MKVMSKQSQTFIDIILLGKLMQASNLVEFSSSTKKLSGHGNSLMLLYIVDLRTSFAEFLLFPFNPTQTLIR